MLACPTICLFMTLAHPNGQLPLAMVDRSVKYTIFHSRSGKYRVYVAYDSATSSICAVEINKIGNTGDSFLDMPEDEIERYTFHSTGKVRFIMKPIPDLLGENDLTALLAMKRGDQIQLFGLQFQAVSHGVDFRYLVPIVGPCSPKNAN